VGVGIKKIIILGIVKNSKKITYQETALLELHFLGVEPT
jgi:hypothetical protein